METIQNNVKRNANRNGNGKARKARATESKVTESKVTESKVTWKKADMEKAREFSRSDFKPLSNADADKGIVTLRKSGKGLKSMAHRLAVGIMLHYVEHGDYTKIYSLLSAVRDAMSINMANGLVKWVVAFSSLQYDDDKALFTNRKGQTRFFILEGDESADSKWHKRGAMNNPFYSASFGDVDSGVKEFDADEYIEKTLQRMFDTLAEKLAAHEKLAAEKGKARQAAKIKVNSTQVDAVKAAAKMFHVNLKLAKSTPANTIPA